ncbi:ribosomal subunit interface protein, partial [Oenococcus oeni]|uniref:ribosome hibernation-promoting factor, HPF/YfiA family n=1 Tax=Oenococcus oeni TaxID=1247 RepID=UPI0008F85DA0
TLLQKFINQFKDFMIAILAVAAVIAAMTGELVDAIFILLVVVLNAIFGVFQESKAEDAIEALKKMSTPNANVRRDGKVVSLPATELVTGDIVLMEAGDIVPADLRLIEANSLKIEVTIPLPYLTLRAEETQSDFYNAVDLVSAKLLRQIRKFKTRVNRKSRER